ncbi:MAG: prepilin-type N-terminal cleavage/methylation domain-containing protein [Syntrophales bacterium]|jgi:general secretion pathway protein I|nr:prepilin-type N-terminal cleavage/methylation domain-containing protein [Syntrophales bacterium]MCK9392839.1 prepilin-type N-terminal cleavage/methylation domain-containing protein [Syntrophales bacterium]
MKRGTRAGAEGFTLLEILVALAIMAIAVTLVLQLFSVNLRAVSIAGDMTSAAIRGEARIREILAEPSLTETSWSETSEDGYRMDVSISEVLKERTDNLPVRLMEVILTIHWMEGRREKSLGLKSQKITDKMAPALKNSAAQG